MELGIGGKSHLASSLCAMALEQPSLWREAAIGGRRLANQGGQLHHACGVIQVWGKACHVLPPLPDVPEPRLLHPPQEPFVVHVRQCHQIAKRKGLATP